MKTLLPVLKTKLFLLGFVSACTIVLATTVPQIRNFIAPEKKIGEKITTEQKKITPKIKSQNKKINTSRLTSGINLGINNSFEATVHTNKADYQPGDYVEITGSGWQPGETVSLNIVSDCGCTNVTYTATATLADPDNNYPGGEIYNAEFLITEAHLDASFTLTATGQSSGFSAQTTFTDGSISFDNPTVCAGGSTTITILTNSLNTSLPIILYKGTFNNVGASTLLQTYNSGPYTYTIPNAQVADAGTYWYSATRTNGNPESNQTTLNVIALTNNTIVSTNQTICSDATPSSINANAAATSFGTLEYRWQSSSDGLNFTNISGNAADDEDYSPATPLSSTWYRRRAFVCLNGPCTQFCESFSNAVKITINNVTGGTIAANQTICGSDPAAFTETGISTGSGTLTYQWQNNTTGCGGAFTNIGGANGTTYDESSITQTTYYRRLTFSTLDGNVCTATSNCISVTKQGNATADAGPNQTVCAGAVVNLNGIVTGTPSPTPVWTKSGSGTFGNINSAITTYTPSQADIDAGTVTLTLTADAPGACDPSDFMTLTIRPPFTPGAISTTNQTICSGGDPGEIGSTTIASGGDNNIIYEWRANGSPITSSNNVTYDPPSGLTTTTTYTRWAKDGTCNTTFEQSTGSWTVTVKTLSVAPTSITTDADNYCADAGGNITLTALGGSAGTGAQLYWYTAGCGTGSPNVTAGNVLVVNKPTTTTTFYARYEGDCNMTSCAEVTITVKTLSVAPTSAGSSADNFCSDAGGTLNLTASGGSAGTGALLKWYAGSCGGGTSIGSGSPLNIAKPTATTTYYARYEGTCNTTGCASVTVTVKTLSTAPTSITTDANNFCSDAGGNITLTANGGSAGTNAQLYWYTAGCGTGSSNVTAGNTFVVNKPTTTTTYYARYEGDCNTTDCASVTITVKQKSAAPTSATATSLTICSGQSTDLSLIGGGGGDNETVHWYTGSCGGTPVGGNGYTVSPTATTIYYGRYEDGAPCNFNTTCAQVTITVNQLPNNVGGGFTGNTICPGENGQLTYDANNTGFASPHTIYYSDGVTTWSQVINTASATAFNVAVNPTITTAYTLTKIVDGNGCERTSGFIDDGASITVRTLPNNVSSTGFQGNTICAGGTGVLTFNAIDATFSTAYTIEYTDGVTTWSQLIPTDEVENFNVAVNPLVTTNYSLVSITNGFGCKRTTGFGDGSATITVNQLPTITLGANPAICRGTTTANLPYSATTNGANQYSINYDAAAEAETFADVTNAVLAVAPNNIALVVPAGVTPGTYNGVLTVRNSSTTCVSTSYNISVTIDGNPTITTGHTCIGGSVINFTQAGGTTGGTWSVSGGGTINASTGVFTPSSSAANYGCYTVTYKTPNAECSDTKSFYVAPVPPGVAFTVANTCNTNLVASAPSPTGLTTQFNFDGAGWTTSNTSPNATPGCHTVQMRWVLNNACGTLAAGDPVPCSEAQKSAVIFPAAPTVTALSNKCNVKLDNISGVATVGDFTAEYAVKKPNDASFGSWGTLAAANALLDATPGCWSVKARYKLTSTCGATGADATSTGVCGESAEVKAVVFPAKPVVTTISNTCNTKLADITAVSSVTGFTAQYAVKAPNAISYSSFGTLAQANALLANVPGCWSVKARYVLAATCGSTNSGDASTGTCGESDVVNAVVFPAAPLLTAPSNTCNAAFSLPMVAPVTGFGVEYNINYTGWYAAPIVPTTPGCYTIHARYVLIQACGSTPPGSDGPLPPCDDEYDDCPAVIGGCTVSNAVNVVIFPSAPVITAPANTCYAAFTLPVVTPKAGFNVLYSIDGNAYAANPSTTAIGCHTVKAKYVLAADCGIPGGTSAGASAPAGCLESNTVSVVIYPNAPVITAPANTCNAAFTLPAVTPRTGFNVLYSIDGGAYAASPSTTTIGCHTVKAKYVLATDCGMPGGTPAGADAPAGCLESNTVSVVIFPSAPVITAPANTCYAMFTLPAVTPRAGFNVVYSIDGNAYAPNPSTTAIGCHTVKAKYVLVADCGMPGGTPAGASAPASCLESNTVNVVIYPNAPVITATANTCNAMFALPTVTPRTGFNVLYSIDGGTYAVSPSTTTPGCHSVKAKYVLAADCGMPGGTPAGADAPVGCLESNEVSTVIFPSAPVITATANTCNVMFALPSVTPKAGFNVLYSLDGGTYAANPSTTTPGCHTIKAKYVLAADCGGTLSGADAPAGCLESNTVSTVIFPTVPVITATANTCNSMFTLPTVASVTGFNIQYSLDGGAYAANPSTTTPGCHTVTARYVLAATCGSTYSNNAGPCSVSNTVSTVIFPGAPVITATANTCNVMFALPSVTPKAGFNILYSLDGGAYAANPSTTTPGCHTIKAKYVLTADCGGTLAAADAPAGCLESNEVSTVIFPGAPVITATANTCNVMFALPSVTPKAGFNVLYSLDGGAYAANPSTTTPGCHTIKAKYVLAADCGSTLTGADAPAGCLESNEVSTVIFPSAPVITATANTCNVMFALPSVTPKAGFNVLYSLDGGAYAANPSTTTPGCHTIKAKYVLAADCGSTLTGADAPAGCLESNTVSTVIFPTVPVITATANTCNSMFTLPTVASVTGFNVQYSLDGGAYSANPSTTTPGCHTVTARYVLAATCGSTYSNNAGPCSVSNTVSVVIFPTAPTITAPANTCNAAFTLPAVTPVAGFNIKYSIDGGGWSATPSTTAVGCHSIKAKYVLAAACGSTAAYAEGTGSCGESNTVNVVIFPLAPPAPTVNSACNADIVVTPPASVTGFNIEYSFDDGATWGANTPPTADNCTGYKIKTRYVTASACGTIPTGTSSIIAACKESPATTRILDKTAPTITCKVNTTRSTVAGLCTYKVLGYEFDLATASDNCTASGSLIKAWTVTNPNVATLNGTGSLVGTDLSFGLNTIKWTVTDGCTNTSTCSFTVNVNNITTTTSLVVSSTPVASNPVSQQYSDKITCVATVTPANCSGAGFIGGTVTFKIINAEGTVILGTAPVASDGTATLTAPLLENQLYPGANNLTPTNGPLKPGNKTVTACYSDTDPDYTVSNPTAPLIETCEDADVTYNGGTYFTVNPSTLLGTVYLSAYGLDKDDVAAGGARGDIRNATAKFRENSGGLGENGPVLGQASQIPFGLINPGNYQEGLATTQFNETISSAEASSGGKVFNIWVGAGNYYCGGMPQPDYIPVTLAMPGQDFVTGGGYTVFPTINPSAGTYAGTPGKRMNFGFVMKWNPSGKNLQGQVNVIYRRVVSGVTRLYQIKSNAINTLVTENVNDAGQPATGNAVTFRRATISTKANLRDITDPLNPISLGGNLALTVIAWESTTVNTGALDRISVQLTGSGSIGLLFANSWLGSSAQWQTLTGGKIQVRNASTPPPGQQINSITKIGEVDQTAIAQFNVKAYPNPTEHQFTLYLEGASNEKVDITVYDAIGRQVHKIERGDASGAIKFGENLKVGAYFVEVRQGTNRKTLKLIKQ